MDERVYNILLENEYIYNDYYKEESTIETLLSIFPEESELAKKIKVKMLKKIKKQKNYYEYFRKMQMEYNSKFYDCSFE